MALIIGLFASACTEGTVPAQPDQMRWVPKLDVSSDVALANKACVVVYSDGAKTGMVLNVSRDQLLFSLPELSTAEASHETGRSFLRLATYESPVAGISGTRVGVSCLVPASLTDKTLESLAKRKMVEMGERARIHDSPINLHSSGSLAITAASALQASIEPKNERKIIGTDLKANALAAETIERVPGAPVSNYTWPPYTLPTWYVTATATSVITNSSEIYWVIHNLARWSSLGASVSESYPPGFCARQSERWIALNQELIALEAERASLADAVNSIAGSSVALRCQSQGNSKKTCIDFFIATAIAAGVMGGDNRTFNANAPYGASRVQVYLDLDNLQGVYYPTASTAYVPIPSPWGPYIFPYIWPATADPQPHFPESLNMTRNSDGSVTVDMKFWNGFCPASLRTVCPAIDATVKFTKTGGVWTTSENAIDRDNYPSMGIYNEGAGGAFTPVYEDPEGHWSALLGVDRMIQKLRDTRDEQLGGCQLE